MSEVKWKAHEPLLPLPLTLMLLTLTCVHSLEARKDQSRDFWVNSPMTNAPLIWVFTKKGLGELNEIKRPIIHHGSRISPGLQYHTVALIPLVHSDWQVRKSTMLLPPDSANMVTVHCTRCFFANVDLALFAQWGFYGSDLFVQPIPKTHSSIDTCGICKSNPAEPTAFREYFSHKELLLYSNNI